MSYSPGCLPRYHVCLSKVNNSTRSKARLRFMAHRIRERRLHIRYRPQIVSFQRQADIRRPDPLEWLAVLHDEGGAQHLDPVQGRVQGRPVQLAATPKRRLNVTGPAAARQTRKNQNRCWGNDSGTRGRYGEIRLAGPHSRCVDRVDLDRSSNFHVDPSVARPLLS